MNGLLDNNIFINNSGLINGIYHGGFDNLYSSKGGFIQDSLVLHLDAAHKNSIRENSTTWYDLSPKGNNGTFVNSPTISPFRKGSIVFNGSNNYVSIANTSDLNFGSNDFTIELWVSPRVPIPGGTLLSINANTSYYAAIRLQIAETEGPGFLMSSTGNTWALSSGTTVVRWSRGTYNHLILSRSGTDVVFYINGSLANVFGPLSGSLMSFSGTTVNRLGHISGSISSYYNGIVSIFRVYTRSLTPTEISLNYNSSKSRFGL